MFQNTLLIIKPDFWDKRKTLLLHLLELGYQIQTQRRVLFSPEQAAEFYKDFADTKEFMLKVILLSKGNAEAFILARENAVQLLNHHMVCYFGTSIEMEKNLHVSRCPEVVQSELTYIFPNYLHEPIALFEKRKFCNDKFAASLINQLYEIVPAVAKTGNNWRTNLAEWLITSNDSLPVITNQCSYAAQIGYEEKAQQTMVMRSQKLPAKSAKEQPTRGLTSAKETAIAESASSLTASLKLTTSRSSGASSMLLSSTSCVSCDEFDDEKAKSKRKVLSCLEFIRAKTARLPKTASSSSSTVEARLPITPPIEICDNDAVCIEEELMIEEEAFALEEEDVYRGDEVVDADIEVAHSSSDERVQPTATAAVIVAEEPAEVEATIEMEKIAPVEVVAEAEVPAADEPATVEALAPIAEEAEPEEAEAAPAEEEPPAEPAEAEAEATGEAAEAAEAEPEPEA